MFQSRKARWSAAAAVAAGVILVVGLWPEGHVRNGKPQPGRVYALSEVPALVRSAQTFHIHGVQRWPMSGKVIDVPIDTWSTASGACRNTGMNCSENSVNLLDLICDGKYQMEVDHAGKSVRFERVTPLQMRIGFLAEMQNLLFGEALSGQDMKRTGAETIDGRECEVWEGDGVVPLGGNVGIRFKLWFDPSSGVLARAESGFDDSGNFRQTFLLDKIERNVEPPPGIFSTTPPSGYKLINTKETAPLGRLGFASYTGKTLETVIHVGFVLPDGSVVVPWSVRELGKDEPQDGLFAGLVAGGELPKLPVEIYGLTPQIQKKPTYLGKHLAWTKKDGRCIEWALYVPDSDLPSPIRSLRSLARPNPADRAFKGKDVPSALPCTISVTAGDFEELVLGAMAELSDSGTAPTGISYEGATHLAQQIRGSLRTQ